jgi:hypothetical protein
MREATLIGQETGCYVYGVVPADTTVSGLLGLDDVEVELLAAEGLAVAVSRVALDRPPGRRAELMAHSRVVDALAAMGPVVPVRFGSVTVDEQAALEEVLADDRDLVALLEELRSLAQLNIRATYAEEHVLAEVVDADPVIADLRERTRDLPPGTLHPDLVRLGERVSHAVDRLREHDRAELLGAVEPLVIASRVRPAGGLEQMLDVAVLAERSRIDEIEAVLESLAAAHHPRVRLRMVGPVPPYDFVEDRTWA